MQNGSHLWNLALQKRKEGRCPLEPSEVAVLLRAMGYPKETQIYVASGQVYGGHNRMAPLRNMFPNLVNLIYYLISFTHGTCLMKCGLIIGLIFRMVWQSFLIIIFLCFKILREHGSLEGIIGHGSQMAFWFFLHEKKKKKDLGERRLL
jgi:hypothetical protein